MTKKQYEHVCRTRVRRYRKLLLCLIVIIVSLSVEYLGFPIPFAIALPVLVWILGDDLIGYVLEHLYAVKHRHNKF